MNVASLELCKELYELSGWDDTYFTYMHSQWQQGGKTQHRHRLTHTTANKRSTDPLNIPAYDLGYLLRKLPYSVLDEYGGKVFGVNLKATASGGWVVWYGEIGKTTEMYFNSADTPEEALASLAIELFKSGVLKK